MKESKRITVIGLGKMGFVLASLLLKNQYRVTVWNRTPEKAKDLVANGATLAGSVEDAISASDVVVICVFDSESVNNVINTPGVLAKLRGNMLINVTTGSPSEADQLANLLNLHNIQYLDGAILAVPEQMAQADTTICVSGSMSAFETHADVLKAFGGNIKYLGVKPSAASAFDQAILYYMYGSFIGFFEGVLIAEKAGIEVSLLGATIKEIGPGISQFIKYEADVIQSENFEVTQSAMAININAVKRMHATAVDLNINLRFPELMDHYFTLAEKKGLRNHELAALIKIFRLKD
jgi:3-hydroxyisobutyrate dehydrogenase-like beta-hydroxyacid dehydrogenase